MTYYHKFTIDGFRQHPINSDVWIMQFGHGQQYTFHKKVAPSLFKIIFPIPEAKRIGLTYDIISSMIETQGITAMSKLNGKVVCVEKKLDGNYDIFNENRDVEVIHGVDEHGENVGAFVDYVTLQEILPKNNYYF